MENWNTGIMEWGKLAGRNCGPLEYRRFRVSDLKQQDMKKTLTTILVISFLTFFLGCSEPLTTREKGAGIGTVTGASLGAIIGSATGHAGAGAGIGAAVGLIGGALIGDQIQERQKQEQELQQQMATQQTQIERAEQELRQLKQQEAR
jgi:Na+/glutamate symporter